MKTLVIHPKDETTDFLSEIYSGKDWTIINTNISKSALKRAINEHDRIIMLGHGSKQGLIGFNKFIIGSELVYLLREKECVCIWCNADQFVVKYGLKGFYTGMIISEYEEALMYCVQTTSEKISHSNLLFAEAVKKSIDKNKDTIVESIKSIYNNIDDNSVIEFNQQNLYVF